MNAAIDLSHCVKSAENIGSTSYYNICNGSMTQIPWGSADWLGSLTLTFMFILFIGGLIGLGIFISKNL